MKDRHWTEPEGGGTKRLMIGWGNVLAHLLSPIPAEDKVCVETVGRARPNAQGS